jgi:hypothetical protein
MPYNSDTKTMTESSTLSIPKEMESLVFSLPHKLENGRILKNQVNKKVHFFLFQLLHGRFYKNLKAHSRS